MIGLEPMVGGAGEGCLAYLYFPLGVINECALNE